VARYRLRFPLQEFDLSGPEVIVGRSPDCHITIEDPLVSRHHAKLRVNDESAAVTDLGSRNGVRVNGRPIEGETMLKDGDRIRLGTQELVFTHVHRPERAARPTGFMCMCRACGTPYPEGAAACPHCGAPAQQQDEDTTISGLRVEPKRNWTFQLLAEVIEKALATGRSMEADRLMRRAAKEVDERLAEGERIDPAQVAMISTFALRLAVLVGGSEWLAWALTLHKRQNLMPTGVVLDQLTSLDRDAFPEYVRIVDQFVTWWKGKAAGDPPSSDVAALALLEKFARGPAA